MKCFYAVKVITNAASAGMRRSGQVFDILISFQRHLQEMVDFDGVPIDQFVISAAVADSTRRS